MSPSDYLRAILHREAVDTGLSSPLRRLEGQVERLARAWARRRLLEVYPAGAFEKGTANQSGMSIDFVISLSPDTPFTISQIYESLHGALWRGGLDPVRRSVSIGLLLDGVAVDLIPAKREALFTDLHELHSSRRGTAIKTNLAQHLLDAYDHGRQEEIRILKLWRDQAGLDFPSFYLELATVSALRHRPRGELADNVWHVLGYLEQSFVSRGVLDPANVNNVVSAEMTTAEKRTVAATAAAARNGRPWSAIVA